MLVEYPESILPLRLNNLLPAEQETIPNLQAPTRSRPKRVFKWNGAIEFPIRASATAWLWSADATGIDGSWSVRLPVLG